MEAANSSNKSLATADDWQEYGASDFGPEIDLVRNGMYPRLIVLKEYGDLCLRTAKGDERVITDMFAGFEHRGNTRSILPGQTAGLVVYW